MDLRNFSRVLWRFKVIIASGIVVAAGLALLATAQVRLKNGLSLKYRTPTFYKADTTLFVTQPGFPWGSAVQPYLNGGTKSPPILVGDQVRLTNLAQLYATYANTDIVRRMLASDGALDGIVNAQPIITNPNVGAPTLPLIDLSGTANSPARARALAQHAAEALIRYVKAQQASARIPASDRVVIQELQRPRKVVVTQKPKMTPAILVFITVLLVAIGLAFVLDNVRRLPASASEQERHDLQASPEAVDSPPVAGESPIVVVASGSHAAASE